MTEERTIRIRSTGCFVQKADSNRHAKCDKCNSCYSVKQEGYDRTRLRERDGKFVSEFVVLRSFAQCNCSTLKGKEERA